MNFFATGTRRRNTFVENAGRRSRKKKTKQERKGEKKDKGRKKRLTVIQRRGSDESLARRAFQAGVSGGSSGVADALQVVMPEGRTPGRHDGRDTEVRRFSPLPLRRHPSTRARRRSSLLATYASGLFLARFARSLPFVSFFTARGGGGGRVYLAMHRGLSSLSSPGSRGRKTF